MDKLSTRVMALEGPDRKIDRAIAEAIGIGWYYSQGNPEFRYTASLDATMSLVNEHGCDLHIRPTATTVRCFPNEDEGVKVTAKTPAIALCAAALKARGL